jgi:hypothetical protein
MSVYISKANVIPAEYGRERTPTGQCLRDRFLMETSEVRDTFPIAMAISKCNEYSIYKRSVSPVSLVKCSVQSVF